MKNMNNKTFIRVLLGGAVAVLSLGFALVADAQYYNSYYNSTTTYPYQQSYNSYGSSNALYGGSYQNNSSNYSDYTRTCPGGFTVSFYNTLLSCNKNISGSIYGSNYNNYNYGTGSVLGASTLFVPGCLPGYLFSTLTGQRCDGYNSSYSYGNNGSLSGARASIKDYEVRDGDDTSIEEGDDNAELVEVRFDVEDGDIRIDRAEFDFEFTGNRNGKDEPWEIFDKIRLMSDGHEIARINAHTKSNWNKEDSNTHSITFSSLDQIIRKNDSARLTIEADVNSNINSTSGRSASWSVFVPDRGIRAQDGSGRTVYTGDDDENVSIDVE